MSLLLRSRSSFLPLSRTCLSVLCVLGLLAAPAAGAATSKTTKKSSKSSASKTAPAKPADTTDTPAAPPEPAPVDAPVAPEAQGKSVEEPLKPPSEPRSTSGARPPATARPTGGPAPASVPAAPAPAPTVGRLRLGVGPDFFLEGGRMTGEQDINTSRQDESFDYSSAGFLSATAWLTSAVPSVSERLRVGAGVRFFGNYAAGGGRTFGFGLLNELFVSGEYGLPVADKMEVLFGARGGLSVLVPNGSLSDEIHRLQAQGVSVWSVPRVGWLVGPSFGVRRRMSERIWLRADVLAHIEQQYLFATSQDVSGLHFSKNWSTLALRLGLSLGAEFAL